MLRDELDLGLPIRRLAGPARGWVIATTAELDAWINASPLKESLVLRPKPEGVPSLEPFNALLAERHLMREEMARFRDEMRTSADLLRKNIQSMRDGEPVQSTDLNSPLENLQRRIN